MQMQNSLPHNLMLSRLPIDLLYLADGSCDENGSLFRRRIFYQHGDHQGSLHVSLSISSTC